MVGRVHVQLDARGTTTTARLTLNVQGGQTAEWPLLVPRGAEVKVEHGYAAHTVLPLDGASKRARLVARPDADWLERELALPEGADNQWRFSSRGDRCPLCGSWRWRLS